MMSLSVPYIFRHDYCAGFCSFHRMTLNQQHDVENDFVGNLRRLLDKLRVLPSNAIAQAVWKRMCDRNLTFTTPIHTLSMFQFACRNKIHLAWWEEVAIWFHDSVLNPLAKSGENEWASSKFMEAMLGPYLNHTRLNSIAMAIGYTAHELQPNEQVPRRFHLLLDLDLAHLVFDEPGRDVASFCLVEELQKVHSDDRKLLVQFKTYFEKMIRKGYIYRTREFQKWHSKAMDHILALLVAADDELEENKDDGTIKTSTHQEGHSDGQMLA